MERAVCGETEATIVPFLPLPGVPFGRGLRLIESGGQIAISSTPEELGTVIKKTSDDVSASIAEFGMQQDQQ